MHTHTHKTQSITGGLKLSLGVLLEERQIKAGFNELEDSYNSA